ncbi:MAG TPA: hypothetical protein VHQ66_02785, partial [Myxococcota bacterium]|nr:hypothetical protein [Myxococcota bacterium]
MGDSGRRGRESLAERWLGPRGSSLRRARLALLAALVVLVAALVGPLAPWRLPAEASLAAPRSQSRVHTVLVASCAAAAVNALLTAALFATARLWTRAVALLPSVRRSPVSSRTWALLLAGAVLAGLLRLPLASGSLWWDEAWSVRHTLVGRVEPTEAGVVEFRPVRWLDTLWNYRQPTNHVAYSVAARTALGAWRAATGAPPEAFDELALRAPAWLAASASVVAAGLLVHALGFPGAAPAAALLLALHPWHVRFGADGRGYSFVVALTFAGALLLLRALRSDRWGAWLGYAASQAALLWAMPIAAYVPLALAGAGAAAISAGPPAARVPRLARLVVANVVAAMVWLQAMAPNLVQARHFDRLLGEAATFDWRLGRQLYVFATTGLHVRMPALPDVSFPTLTVLAERWPWLPWLVYGALPVLLVGGAARVARRGGAAERALVAALVAAPLLLLGHRSVDGFFAYPRFAIYALVPAVTLLAMGVEGALAAALGARRRAWAPAAALAAVGALTLALSPQLAVLVRLPHAPSREVVELLAAHGGARAGVGLGGDVPRVYDPW